MLDATSSSDSQPNNHFANHAWVAYVSPFLFITPDGEEPWEVTLEEINKSTYDHGKLSRVVGHLPTPLGDDWPMLVCYDGGIAVPRTAGFSRKEAAIDFFSTTMCNLLLGGLLCEAIDTRDVVWGQLHKRTHIWPVNPGASLSSQVHAGLRMRFAGPLFTIMLSSPRSVAFSEFREAFLKGHKLTSQLPSFTPKFFLRGITELRSRNWSASLSNLWITIEQLTDYLWQEKFLANTDYHPSFKIPKRRAGLKDDNRTWSSAVKQEILFQSEIISEETLGYVSPARQARNRLVHKGDDVKEESAVAACRGSISLLDHCVGSLLKLDEALLLPPSEDFRTGDKPPKTIQFEDWNSMGSVDS